MRFALPTVLAGTVFLVVASWPRAGPGERAPDARTTEADATLYLIENIAPKGTVDVRDLVRYRFHEGEVTPKEVVVSKDQRFFGHFGGHHLLSDRFLVTKFGAVIDLRGKKVLHDEDNGNYLGTEGSRVVFQMDNESRPKGFFAFDLETGKLSKLDDPGHWALPGVKSPDRAASVVGGGSEVWLHRPGRAAVSLGKQFASELSALSSSFPEAPLLWLDAERILTQTGNGKLVVLKTDGTTAALVAIGDLSPPVSRPRLHRDRDGNVVYTCGRSFLIDVKAKKALPYRWRPLGHGFECDDDWDSAHGHVIRYRGRTIGRLWCDPLHAATSDGLLAIAYGPPGSNLGYPKGVKVWSRTTSRWTAIDAWFNDVVGWTP